MPGDDIPIPDPRRPPATLIVVPANDRALFDYLSASLAPLADVEVILDRRRSKSAESKAPIDPSTSPNRRAWRPLASAFQCLVVRRPAPAAQPGPVAPTHGAAGEAYRTLLWPALRLGDLLPELTTGQPVAPRRPSPRPV